MHTNMTAQDAYTILWILWARNYWKDSAVVIQVKTIIVLNTHSKTAICGTSVVNISFGLHILHKEITRLFCGGRTKHYFSRKDNSNQNKHSSLAKSDTVRKAVMC